MKTRIALSALLAALALTACDASTPEALDGQAYCQLLACSGVACDPSTLACVASVGREDYFATINDCGSRLTCAEVTSCAQAARPETRDVDTRALEACYAWAGRCGGEGAACGGTEVYSERYARGVGACYAGPCDQLEACLNGLVAPACAAATE